MNEPGRAESTDEAGAVAGAGSVVGAGAASSDASASDVSPGQVEALSALEVPTQRIIAIGLGLWLVALAVTLIVPALHTGSRDWWPWACVAGFGLGSVGFLYVRRGRGNAHDAG